MILHYTVSGFMFNGVPCSIPQLSQVLQTPQNKIMELVSKTAENMGSLTDMNQIEDTIKSIVTLGSTWAIQDRGQVHQQLNILMKAQDGTYKPFISGEVNKAMKLLLDSNKNILDMYKTFFTSQSNTTNILNIYQKDKDSNQDQDYVTPDIALNLVLDHNPSKAIGTYQEGQPPRRPSELTDEDIENLYEEHRVGDSPEVLEGRSGTEALRALEVPEGPKAHAISKAASRPKKKAGRLNSHENPDLRRGLEFEDVDELPE